MDEKPTYDTLRAFLREACYNDEQWSGGFNAVPGCSLHQFGVTGYGAMREDGAGTRIWCIVFGCEDDDLDKPENVIAIDPASDLNVMHHDIAKFILSDFDREQIEVWPRP